MNKKIEKLKKIIYDHWLASLPVILPVIGTSFLMLWKYFRNLMMEPIPFIIVLICLFIIGVLILWGIKIKKSNKKLKQKLNIPEIKIKDNLIYKGNENYPCCLKCYEEGRGFKHMRRYEREGGVYYECLICDYGVVIYDEDEDIDVEDIPF